MGQDLANGRQGGNHTKNSCRFMKSMVARPRLASFVYGDDLKKKNG